MDSFKYEVGIFNINVLNEIDKFFINNPSKSLKLIIDNTRAINLSTASSLLKYKNLVIQVKGPFNDNFLKKYQINKYVSKENLYTPFTFYLIIKEIEKLEKEVFKALKPLPKVFMIYDILRTKMKVYLEEEINGLEGLITRKINPMGESLILKEFLDRLMIPNKLIFTTDYRVAFNLIKINKYYYLLDLPGDTYKFQNNLYSKIEGFSNMDKRKFMNMYSFNKEEGINNLDFITILNSETINILRSLTIPKQINTTYLILNRKDTSSIVMAKMNNDKYMEEGLNRYFIADIYKGFRFNNPKVFYTRSDLLSLGDNINLLSDSFLGRERLNNLYNNHNYNLGILNSDLSFRDDKDKYSSNLSIRIYKKNNGGSVILEKTYQNNLFFYNYYELYFGEDKDMHFFQGEIITSSDLFSIPESYDNMVANKFLGLDRVVYHIKYLGGYLGYFKIK